MKKGELGKTYNDGEVIFNEGEEGDSMFVIQSGKVKISKKVDFGDITITIMEEGEIFGEMAIFDRLPRSASAVAFGGARVLTVDKKKFLSVVNRDPTLAFKIFDAMSKRVRRLDAEVLKLKKQMGVHTHKEEK